MDRILVVCDNESDLQQLVQLFKLRGNATVTAATDGEVALAIAAYRQFDLLILCERVFFADDARFVDSFRSGLHHRGVPVLCVMTGANEERRQEALRMGAYDVLVLPISGALLGSKVEEVLSVQRVVHPPVSTEPPVAPLQVDMAEDTVDTSADIQTITLLVRICEHRDVFTAHHMMRVATLAAEIAREMGVSDALCTRFRWATMTHDVGKVAIPDSIVFKDGNLTDEERQLMQEHTVIGAEILSGNASPVMRLAAEIALRHHERWDGAGYPDGFKGEDIPLSARIVAVADVYDALISARSYKNAWTELEACNFVLANKGTLFDPGCVAAFERYWTRTNGMSALPVAASA